MTRSESPFQEHDPSFRASSVPSEGVELSEREARFGELVAEIIWGGAITIEDRVRMKKAADVMGLEPAQAQRIEDGIRASHEARYRRKIVEVGPDESPPPPSMPTVPRAEPQLEPPAPDTFRSSAVDPLEWGRTSAQADPMQEALAARVAFLYAENQKLVKDLEDARSEISRLRDAASAGTPRTERDPTILHAQLCEDPADPERYHRLFSVLRRESDLEQRWNVAHALVALGAATQEERAHFDANRGASPIRPAAPLEAADWRGLALHPDEELLAGDIFAVIAPAVLLAQIASMHARVPTPPASLRVDPVTSTLESVRAVSWSSAILGLATPPVYVDPAHPCFVEIVPGTPAALRLGERAIAQRLPTEHAFAVGRQLVGHRAEHFVASLITSPRELDDLFLAALVVGNPSLPMSADTRSRVEPVYRALEPLLAPAQRERLRKLFIRFVEVGGRTNLRKWAIARESTALMIGLLLANDLAAAQAVLEEDDPTNGSARFHGLLAVSTSQHYAKLRRKLGVEVRPQPKPA